MEGQNNVKLVYMPYRVASLVNFEVWIVITEFCDASRDIQEFTSKNHAKEFYKLIAYNNLRLDKQQKRQ